jgi:hypothetical protein
MRSKFDYLYVVGDSFAFNDDVPKPDLFAEIVAKHYDLELHNFGVGGAGNEYIFKKAYSDIQRIVEVDKKNPLVMIVWTDYTRKEIYNRNYGRPINIAENNYFDKDFIKAYMVDHFNEKTLRKDSIAYIKAVQTLLQYYKLNRIEMFSLGYIDTDIDTSRLIGDIGTIFLEDRLPIGNIDKIGHFTSLGNRKTADYIISSLDEWY